MTNTRSLNKEHPVTQRIQVREKWIRSIPLTSSFWITLCVAGLLPYGALAQEGAGRQPPIVAASASGGERTTIARLSTGQHQLPAADSFTAESASARQLAQNRQPPVATGASTSSVTWPVADDYQSSFSANVSRNETTSSQQIEARQPLWPNDSVYGADQNLPVERQVSTNDSTLSLTDAVRLAVSTHPAVAESLGRLYQQDEEVNIARSGYYPEVSSGISSQYRDSTGRTEESFTVSASQMLYDFGKVSSDVDIELYGVERGQAQVWLSVDQLARDTALAAIEVQRYQALRETAQEQIAGIEDIEKLVSQRVSMGASSRSDEIQAQSRVEAAEATELEMQAQLDVWRRALQSYVGSVEPVGVTPDFPTQLIQACTQMPDDFDLIPELMVARAEMNQARASINRAQSELYPTISLGAGYDQYLNRNMAGDDNDFNIQLNLTSTVYQGGAKRARERGAAYSLQAAEAARDRAILDISRNINEARDQTVSLSRRLAILEARSSSIEETQELYRRQYLDLGARSLLDLLNTEQEIYQARFDYQNTLYDVYRLQINCLYSSAGIRGAFGLNDEIFQGVSVSP